MMSWRMARRNSLNTEAEVSVHMLMMKRLPMSGIWFYISSWLWRDFISTGKIKRTRTRRHKEIQRLILLFTKVKIVWLSQELEGSLMFLRRRTGSKVLKYKHPWVISQDQEQL